MDPGSTYFSFRNRVSRGLLIGLLLLLSACGAEERLPRPEDVLDRILLDYPSVLGYVRIHMDTCRTLQGLQGGPASGDAPFTTLGRLMAGVTGFPRALLDQVIAHAREDSHLILMLVDPEVFGGPAALYFEPGDTAGLEASLDGLDGFTRVPGREPPEFTLHRRVSRREWILELARAIGVDISFEVPRASRLVVEETPGGTLIMPSLDLREDFKVFLEDTAALGPWSGAGLVVNLEIHRLARAYIEGARTFNRVVAELLRRAAGFFKERKAVASALERMAEFVPEVALESIKAVEGIRFVSKTPGNGRPELTIVATEDGALAGMLPALQGGDPDLIGLMPTGLAVQVNTDPLEAARLVKRGILYYGNIVDLEEEMMEKSFKPLLSAMAHDSGRYLLGVDGTAVDRGACVLISALEGAGGTASSIEMHGSSMIEPVLDLLIPGEEIPVRRIEGGIQRYDFPWVDVVRYPFPWPFIETGCADGMRVTALQVAAMGETGGPTQAMLRLRRIGAGRVVGLPGGAALYFKLTPPQAFNNSFFPGFANMMNLVIMGSGVVEENRMIINFL